MEIRIPEVGESVFEALVARWHKKNGEQVSKDDLLCEIETDKITLEINAESDGFLSIGVPDGTTVKIGTVIGTIEESSRLQKKGVLPSLFTLEPQPVQLEVERIPPGSLPVDRGEDAGAVTQDMKPGVGREPLVSPAARKLARGSAIAPDITVGKPVETRDEVGKAKGPKALAPGNLELPFQVRNEEPVSYGPVAAERIYPDVIDNTPVLKTVSSAQPDSGRVTRIPMTPIRRRIAERVLAARQQTAMLTTFNEADLGEVMELKKRYGAHFLERHGVPLGFMSFFVKACCEALKQFPAINGRIDGSDIVHNHFYDIGIAVGAEKGLVVPVIRAADRLSFAGIEKAIADFVDRIKTNRLNLSDLEGGTFTITNGGVYGSLLSTPILNSPQSGVLGMHAIKERPVAHDGKVVVRPMMYLALSYDHRIIDGREAVGFLKMVKEYIEDPEELLLDL